MARDRKAVRLPSINAGALTAVLFASPWSSRTALRCRRGSRRRRCRAAARTGPWAGLRSVTSWRR